MSIDVETYPYDDRMSESEQDTPDYGLDEDRWLALPVEARVAFGIAWLKAAGQVFETSSDITVALVDSAGLDEKEIRASNRSLLQKGYLDRSGFLTVSYLELSLSEEGYEFLEAELEKTQDLT